MKVLVLTYGCQMNERDSEAVSALLAARGYERAVSEAEADVVVVNTCSVRGKAEAKALGKLGLLAAAARRQGRPRAVGAMGCMVQRLGPRLLDKVPLLDFGVGTHALSRLPAVLEQVLAGAGPVVEIGEDDDPDQLAGHLPGGISAFVNVLLGCNRRCTYCIVPTVRGAEWSRPAASVVREVERLAAGGVREVTLLGQSVMSYGRSGAVWEEGIRSPLGLTEAFPRLLEAVAAVPGILRVRFTSGHPSGCTDELARVMAAVPAVCEHLHLPVQSGSDAVLARMRRGYDTQAYRRAVERLRLQVPTVALTTDIIVGFPGETEADFEATHAFMEEMAFDSAFIFKYSPRTGTPAATWDDDVPDEEKQRRNRVLLDDQDRRAARHRAALHGQSVEVLAEGPSTRNAARWSGRTRRNRTAVFEPPPGVEPGRELRLRVEWSTAQTLYGVVEETGS